MYVWIVWGDDGPVAVFSSEQRAMEYIARNGARGTWRCSGACVNLGDGLHLTTLPAMRKAGVVLS